MEECRVCYKRASHKLGNVFVCGDTCADSYWESLSPKQQEAVEIAAGLTAAQKRTATPVPNAIVEQSGGRLMHVQVDGLAKVQREIDKPTRVIYLKFDSSAVTYAAVQQLIAKLEESIRSQGNDFWTPARRASRTRGTGDLEKLTAIFNQTLPDKTKQGQVNAFLDALSDTRVVQLWKDFAEASGDNLKTNRNTRFIITWLADNVIPEIEIEVALDSDTKQDLRENEQLIDRLQKNANRVRFSQHYRDNFFEFTLDGKPRYQKLIVKLMEIPSFEEVIEERSIFENWLMQDRIAITSRDIWLFNITIQILNNILGQVFDIIKDENGEALRQTLRLSDSGYE